MRQHWSLPDDLQCRYTGRDWLLLLLESCTAEQRDMLLLLLWRSWYVHNNLVHGAGPTSVGESVGFLLRYWDSLNSVGEPIYGDNAKGKEPLSLRTEPGRGHRRQAVVNCRCMIPPDGWAKVNVDGSFVDASGEAGVGVVARDSSGHVIFSAWKYAAEAEALAFTAGHSLGNDSSDR